MEKRIRIKDIAERAGVSTGTVDRVIHQRGNVSPEVADRVMQVMRELNYEPNIIASTLAYNRKLPVGVLLPDYYSDPYWALPNLGLKHAFQKVRHYGIVLDTHLFGLFDPVAFLAKAHELLAAPEPPVAILFAPIFLRESIWLLEQCRERGIATVLINTDMDDPDALCYVGQDSYQSGVLAGKLLSIGMGPDDQVLVLNLDKETTNAKHLWDKERGLRDYFLRLTGPEVTSVIRYDCEFFEDQDMLRDAMLHLFRENPQLSRIFVTNSRSYFVLDALNRVSLRHFRTVGFDLLPQNMTYLEQGTISFLINQNPVEQGYLALMNIANHFIYKKPVKRMQYLPLDIVVPENARYYLQREKDLELVF